MITVNGEPRAWHQGMTVSDMLQACNYRFPLLIITVGEELIARKDYDTAIIPDGADVKAVHLMSGG
jgi:thiamine biosynthesis protein ThiS